MEENAETELVASYCRHLSYFGSIAPPTTRAEAEQVRELVAIACETDDDLWTAEAIDSLISQDPSSAWRVLLATINICEEHTLCIVGSAQLENFLGVCCPAFDDAIAEELRVNLRFRNAFLSAFLYDVPEPSWRRFHSTLLECGFPSTSLPDWTSLKPST